MEKDGNTVESSEESSCGNELEEVKRENWVERMWEIRSHWRNRQQEGDAVGEEVSDEEKNDENDCEVGCLVDYNSDGEGAEEIKYDRETFSRFLAPVSWSDTKLFSKLAFLSNMAYVIPEIKVRLLFSTRC